MEVTKQMRKEVKKFVDHADDKVIKIFYAVMEAEKEEDWWNDLPPEVQKEIDGALLELDKGKGMSHEKVMKKHAAWFQMR